MREFPNTPSLYDAGLCLELYNIDDRRTFRFRAEEFDAVPRGTGEKVMLRDQVITAYKIEDLR